MCNAVVQDREKESCWYITTGYVFKYIPYRSQLDWNLFFYFDLFTPPSSLALAIQLPSYPCTHLPTRIRLCNRKAHWSKFNWNLLFYLIFLSHQALLLCRPTPYLATHLPTRIRLCNRKAHRSQFNWNLLFILIFLSHQALLLSHPTPFLATHLPTRIRLCNRKTHMSQFNWNLLFILIFLSHQALLLLPSNSLLSHPSAY